METLKLPLNLKVYSRIGYFCFVFNCVYISAVVDKNPFEMVDSCMKPLFRYILGTDNFGRDVFVELIHGMKISDNRFVCRGDNYSYRSNHWSFAGYKGGTVDNILNSITNIFLVIPPFVILILITVSLRSRSLAVMGLVLGITSWPWTARAVRAQSMSLRGREHVDIARLNGASVVEIIIREIMPYILSYIFMAFVLQVASGILNEAGISMLGLGPSNVVSLGTMLSWALFFESVRSGACGLCTGDNHSFNNFLSVFYEYRDGRNF